MTNADAKPTEPPKVERQRACRCVTGFEGYCPQHGSTVPFWDPRERPAPAPEPQGSEEPDPRSTSYGMLYSRWEAVSAELASAREEIATTTKAWAEAADARDVASLRAERSESRVKKLEDMMVEASGGVDGKIDALVLGVNPTGIEARIRAEGRAILAAREGESR